MVVGVATGWDLWFIGTHAVLGPLSMKLATPVPRSSSTTGCCINVGGGCPASEKVDRSGRVLVFRLVYCWLFLFHQPVIFLFLLLTFLFVFLS